MTHFVLHHNTTVSMHPDALAALGWISGQSIGPCELDKAMSATIQARARAIARERVPDHLPRHKRR